MTDIADIVLRVDSTELVNATKETKRLSQSAVDLLSSLDRVAAAQISHARATNTLKSAVQAGVLSYEESRVAVDALTQRLEAQGMTLNNLGKVVTRNNGVFSRSGVVMQQAGYQVGDFLVQVQSGTNWMVAFGQQATQLVGVLPLMTGAFGLSSAALIGLSAGLGIIIPLVTAVGAYFLRAGEDVKKSKVEVDAFTESLKGLEEIIKRNQMIFNKIKFGVDEDALAAAYEQMDQFQLKILETANINLEFLKTMNIGGGEAYAAAIAAQQKYIADLKDRIKKEQDGIDKIDGQKRALQIYNGMLAVQMGYHTHIGQLLEASKTKAYNMAMELVKTSKINITGVFSNANGAASILSGTVNNIYNKLFAVSQLKISGSASVGLPKEPLQVGWGKDSGQGAMSINMPSAGAVAGVGTGGGNARLETLLASLGTEKEQLDAWYQQSQDDLQAASDKELEIVGGREEAKHRLIMEYQQKQYDAQQAQTQLLFQSQSGMYSALGDLLGQFAGKSKGAAVAALAIQKGLAIAQIVTSTAAAQMRAYAEMGPIAGAAMAAKIGLLGKLQMGLVAATGLAQAGSIMGGGSSSSGRGSVGTSSVSSSVSAAPTTVMIQGMKPTDIFTGEQLSTLFDSLYKENNNRGMVFMVQR